MNYRILIFAILILVSNLVFATDPWNNPSPLAGSMTVMAQVSINGSPAVSGDVLAAFVSVGGTPELRGKGLVQVVSGISGCLLQVFTDNSGEVISFKVWDESAQHVFEVSQTLVADVDGTIGSYPSNLYQINADVDVQVVAVPSFSIPAGTYYTQQYVSLSCPTTDAQIHYTTNGTNPTETSALYSAAISISTTTTLKAKAFFPGWTPSAVATALYIISGTVATPTFSPPPGQYELPMEVTISCATPDAQIRYTINGAEPDTTSALYAQPLYLLLSANNVQAKGFKTGLIPSETAIGYYESDMAIPDNPDTPVVTGIFDVYPNPFSYTTTIQLGAKEANQPYSLKIYNIKGACVYRTEGVAKGSFELSWDGCSSEGKRLSSGIYLISFRAGNTTHTRKTVLK
ncbi:MAG: chitobiase/beta-hexosaminidase C-terminal domain-containing protein [Candidatus Cloacimonetes bacterium]|nr:chitobiase/beta-hexosaminidase C-terminal domain-containing protein [Candidatus Cloacimonadota bacterium]